MSLPRALTQAGYQMPQEARRRNAKYRGLMLATEGRSDTGKTEFILSCPGPGVVIGIDRGFDAVFDNENPPPTRREDFGFKVLPASKETQEIIDVYVQQWAAIRTACFSAVLMPEVRTFALDGDSDSWEVQRLSEHGKLAGIFPATKYGPPKAARRGFYNRLWDSGKIVVATNKLAEEWLPVLDKNGLPVLDNSGEVKKGPSGQYKAQGFPDQEYLWQIRLRHLFEPATTIKGKHVPKRWGIRILKCKPNMDLIGEELWGEDCCFAGLVQFVYPNVELAEWGF